MVLLMNLGGIPRPVHTPPMVVEEEVTKGYVPKSISSKSALAPSTRIRLPEETAEWMYVTESMMCGLRRCARICLAKKSVYVQSWVYMLSNLVSFNLAFGVVLKVSIPLESAFHDFLKLLSKVIVVEQVMDS